MLRTMGLGRLVVTLVMLDDAVSLVFPST